MSVREEYTDEDLQQLEDENRELRERLERLESEKAAPAPGGAPVSTSAPDPLDELRRRRGEELAATDDPAKAAEIADRYNALMELGGVPLSTDELDRATRAYNDSVAALDLNDPKAREKVGEMHAEFLAATRQYGA